MTPPVAISATGAMLGLFLLIFAWRGRRIDDHPLCRKCGFDLVGLPSGGERCSECGVNLKRRRAIRIGHRRVRRPWLLLAILMLIGDGGWLSVRAYQFVRHEDLNPYKPVWLLLIEARGNAPKRDPAFTRLLQLLGEKKLNGAQTHHVIDLILAAQADPKRTWQKEWGRMVEDLRDENLVTEEQWQKYWREALSLSLDLRQEVSKDDNLPARLLYSLRAKDSGRHRIEPPILLKAAIADLPLLVSSGYEPNRQQRIGTVVLGLDEVVTRVSEGKQTVRATVAIQRYPPFNLSRTREQKQQKSLPPLMIPIEAQFTLVPPRRATVVLVNKPQIESQLLQTIHLEPITVQRRKGTSEQTASLTITIKTPPIDVAFLSYIRQGGFEWPIGRLACARFGHEETHLEGRADNLEEAEAVLILRPDAAAAASTIQIKEIWGDEIVIEKVPVRGGWAPTAPPSTTEAVKRVN